MAGKISEMAAASTLQNTDMMELCQGDSINGYASVKMTLLALATKIAANINYTSELLTNSKTLTGALNEIFASGNLADTYDTTDTYDVGDYCIYQGKLYKCTAQTTGAFDSNDWAQTTITDELGGGGGSSTLAGLSDVAISSLTDGQILVYDGTASKWKNQTIANAESEVF